MTGEEFQWRFCDILWKLGYWALNIPRDKRGAQPFDVVAIKGSDVFAFDCKVCKSERFPLSRIEDNQWTSFATVEERTNATAAIAVYHDDNIYIVYHKDLLKMLESGEASFQIKKFKPILTKKEIDLIERL